MNLCSFDFKEYTTNVNAGRASFRLTLPNMVGILLIIVASLTLTSSCPASMFLNTQVADAAIQPSHTYLGVLQPPSPQLVDLRLFPLKSDSTIMQIAMLQFPSAKLPRPVPIAPITATTLSSPNPFNTLTAAAATVSSQLPSVVTNQIVPLIQGTTNNGFVSYLCPTSTVQSTPSPSLLNFRAATSTYNSIVSIVSNNPSIPMTGAFTLFNPQLTGGAVPILTGQINSGTFSGNSFTLQGTLTANGISGIGDFCGSIGASTLFPFAFSGFTISGTCGTNFPLAFAIDRSVLGAFNARVACNSL
jgi:hypothetical protein